MILNRLPRADMFFFLLEDFGGVFWLELIGGMQWDVHKVLQRMVLVRA